MFDQPLYTLSNKVLIKT